MKGCIPSPIRRLVVEGGNLRRRGRPPHKRDPPEPPYDVRERGRKKSTCDELGVAWADMDGELAYRSSPGRTRCGDDLVDEDHRRVLHAGLPQRKERRWREKRVGGGTPSGREEGWRCGRREEEGEGEGEIEGEEEIGETRGGKERKGEEEGKEKII
jgi:hypothetical protein